MIYCLMGKSASGKDTIYQRLLAQKELQLTPVIPYTTRPIREGECEGREYHFTDEAGLKQMEAEGRVIEKRVYHTVHGDWTYFTADDPAVNPVGKDYLLIGTLEVYNAIRGYYGQKLVRPLYICIPDDGARLERALKRERAQKEPKYKEMCRRFLADEEDFSEEKLKLAHIAEEDCFDNTALEECLRKLTDRIMSGR